MRIWKAIFSVLTIIFGSLGLMNSKRLILGWMASTMY